MQEKTPPPRNPNQIQNILYSAGIAFLDACKRTDPEAKQLSYKVFVQLFMQRWQIDGLPLPDPSVWPSSQLEMIDVVYDTQLISWVGEVVDTIEKKNHNRLGC